MPQIKININDVNCNIPYNEIEVKSYARVFQEGKAIPSPVIDNKNKVIAFSSSFYALKDMKIPEIFVVKD